MARYARRTPQVPRLVIRTQQKEHGGRGIPGPGECGMRRQGAETLRFIQFKHELRTGLKFWERLRYIEYRNSAGWSFGRRFRFSRKKHIPARCGIQTLSV